MRCEICGAEMSRIHGFNGFGYGGFVCQNDDCGKEPEECEECGKVLADCYCDLYEKEEESE